MEKLLNKNKFRLLITLGFIILTSMLFIEYLNHMVLNDSNYVNTHVSNNVFYLIRINLWRIHLFLGVLFLVISAMAWRMKIAKEITIYFEVLIAIGATGLILVQLESLFFYTLHILLAIISVSFFLALSNDIFMFVLTKKRLPFE